MSRVKHDAFGPFLIRMDSDIDHLIERNVRTPRERDRRGDAPARSKQRREKKASHPSEILQ
jgi:hypothetical protein